MLVVVVVVMVVEGADQGAARITGLLALLYPTVHTVCKAAVNCHTAHISIPLALLMRMSF